MLAAYAGHVAIIVVTVHLVLVTRSPYCARTLDALSFLYQTTVNLRQGSLPSLLWRNEMADESMWSRLDLVRRRNCHILCTSSLRFCGHSPIPMLSDFPFNSTLPTGSCESVQAARRHPPLPLYYPVLLSLRILRVHDS